MGAIVQSFVISGREMTEGNIRPLVLYRNPHGKVRRVYIKTAGRKWPPAIGALNIPLRTCATHGPAVLLSQQRSWNVYSLFFSFA